MAYVCTLLCLALAWAVWRIRDKGMRAFLVAACVLNGWAAADMYLSTDGRFQRLQAASAAMPGEQFEASNYDRR